jgi:hypothetical protein
MEVVLVFLLLFCWLLFWVFSPFVGRVTPSRYTCHGPCDGKLSFVGPHGRGSSVFLRHAAPDRPHDHDFTDSAGKLMASVKLDWAPLMLLTLPQGAEVRAVTLSACDGLDIAAIEVLWHDQSLRAYVVLP